MGVDDLRTFEMGRAKVQNTVFWQLFYFELSVWDLKVLLKSREMCVLRTTEIHPFRR